jgi:RNA polymerase sigma factor (sigma-70 family)
MYMNTLLDYPALTDRRLVELHLDGDRSAFRQIVERYQAMICALGLSACGDVARSEDIAQEVFVVAWKQLPDLQEPDRLRPWLSGIARNLINNSFRRQQRTPTARAEPLSPETLAGGDSPREQAIHADETALMWSALEGIPENYREPMVLFYREHRSVPAVAAALEISEENVRQRLARGRAMLTERMAKIVEETLERSAPTPAFAGMVMLGLPFGIGPGVIVAEAGAVSAKTAGGPAAKTAVSALAAGSAAAKGGAAIKLFAAFAALPALMGGLTDYLRFRAAYAAASPDDRADVIKCHLLPLLFNAAVLGGAAFVFWLPLQHSGWKALALIPAGIALFAAARLEHKRRKAAGGRLPVGPAFEYRRAGGFLGLPWVHVRSGGGWRGKKAAGWIALSDGVSIGGLVASGPLAIAPIGVGGVAVGLLALGGAAVGYGAIGVAAAGNWAVGGLVFAAHAAQGALAFAQDFATGLIAVAAHANDEVAKAYFHEHVFFGFSHFAGRVAIFAAFLGWLPPLALMGWHLRRRRAQR